MGKRVGLLGPIPNDWDEAALQADTAIRSAADVLSLGLADEAAAKVDSLPFWPGRGRDYDTAHLEQQARDNSDAYYRPVARGAGAVLGTGLAIYGGAGLGTRWSAGLPIQAKGRLGEQMSKAKTIFTGDWPVAAQKRVPLSQSYTVADQLTALGKIVESKFGPMARLSKNQRRAVTELGARYRVDRWMPYHVGRVTGTGAGTAVGSRRVLGKSK